MLGSNIDSELRAGPIVSFFSGHDPFCAKSQNEKMGDVRVYALDWYFSLRQRLEREHEGVLVVPPFEYKCNVFADLVFSVCGRLGLDRHPEVKYKALQYFEKTVEVKLAGAFVKGSVRALR